MAEFANVNLSVLRLTAQAAATVNSSDMHNHWGRGVKLIADITAVDAGTTLTLTLQGKDAVSGKYYTILASTALGSVGTTIMTIYPGAVVTANLSANDLLPVDWRINAVIAGAGHVTATVGGSVML